MKLDCESIRGANYIPSYAKDDIEIWLKFNQEIVDKELGYAEELGLNSVRIWINYLAYKEKPKILEENIDNFLNLCEKHHLTSMLIPFDSCMVDKNDPKTTELFRKRIDESKESYDYVAGALLWPQSPGYSKLGEENWANIRKYVDAVVGKHADDKRVIVWDVMNEPFGVPSNYPEYDENRISKFLKHFCAYFKSLSKDIPITIGAGSWEEHTCCVPKVEPLVDVVSFHSYEANPVKFDRILNKAREYRKKGGKKIILSEWGNSVYSIPKGATDEEQFNYYQNIMPLVMEAKIGWYFFDLMVGQGPFAHQGIFYPNGEKRPVVKLIKTLLR